MKNVFENESYEILKSLYIDILNRREEGLRPHSLDPYIEQVQKIYPLTKGEGRRYTENMSWEEVGKRYFRDNSYGLKLSVGTKVRIRADLQEGVKYGWHTAEKEMIEYAGKEATIIGYEHEEDCEPAYLLDIDDKFWSWSDEMFAETTE